MNYNIYRKSILKQSLDEETMLKKSKKLVHAAFSSFLINKIKVIDVIAGDQK